MVTSRKLDRKGECETRFKDIFVTNDLMEKGKNYKVISYQIVKGRKNTVDKTRKTKLSVFFPASLCL